MEKNEEHFDKQKAFDEEVKKKVFSDFESYGMHFSDFAKSLVEHKLSLPKY